MNDEPARLDYIDTDGVTIQLTKPTTRALYAAVAFLLGMIEQQASNSASVNTLSTAQAQPVGDSHA